MSLYVDPADASHVSVLRFQAPSQVVVLGGVGALLIHAGILINAIVIALILRGCGVGGFGDAADATQPAMEEEVIEAHFVTLGRELDPNEMPNRIVPRLSTAPRRPSNVPTRDTPRERAEAREHPEDPPPDAVEDELTRIGDRAQAFAEIAEEREREGNPDGIEGGTEREATEGDLYAGRLSAFFRNGWTVPTTLNAEEIQAMSATVRVQIGPELQIVDFDIRNSSGNALFDQSVVEQLTRLRASDQRIPPPPEELAAQYVGAATSIRFNGRQAR